jgi:phosphotransferase system enzyme I (PtsI)
VAGLSNVTAESAGVNVIAVDGEKGEVILDPDEAALKAFGNKITNSKKNDAGLEKLINLRAQTTDARQIMLKANLEIPEETSSIFRFGAEGVGLFRSEFLFLTAGLTTEEERQYEAYSLVLKSAAGKPVTIRTIDVGGDKIAPGFFERKEGNPLLGLRAIRSSLAMPEIFKTQLRAILRAGVHGDVRIMFPMIAEIDELEQALALVDEAKQELKNRKAVFNANVPTGIMIEVPSAALTAGALAKKAAFLSIGTNDLLQYTVAADRGNEKVSYLADQLQPSLLRLIKMTVDAAHENNISCAVCGEMGGSKEAAAILIGLGVDELSMSAQAIPAIKSVIRSCSYEQASALASKALECASAKEVRALLAAEQR